MEMSGYVYTCSAGESFDSIARDIYGDEKHAAELLCANPEQGGKLIFAGGEALYLPVVAVRPEAETEEEALEPDAAPWKE